MMNFSQPEYETEARQWDSFAENYELIFSPFASVMTAKSPSGKQRNLLLDYLQKEGRQNLQGKRIADYGCGPGNLVPHLTGLVQQVFGVDISPKALEIAAEKAVIAGLEFSGFLSRMEDHVPESPYDLIISVNSILPSGRASVSETFSAIAKGLSRGGSFVGILPSFDTVEYMIECHKNMLSKDDIEALIARWNLNREDLSCNDENHIRQCYHTPESLGRELSQAGLKMSSKPQKVYYPWNLSSRYGYGYFPDKEEIWDWFVVASKP